jgi:hypothetical protein
MDSERYDLVFLALARDCASGASSFIRGIQRLSARGLNVMALVGENGSTEDTRSLLLRSDAPIRVIDTSVMEALETGLRGWRGADNSWPMKLAASRPNPYPWSTSMNHFSNPYLLKHCSPLSAVSGGRRPSASAQRLGPTLYDLLAYEDESASFVGLADEINALKSRPLP